MTPQLVQLNTRSPRRFKAIMLAAALGLILWPRLTMAQTSKGLKTLGPNYIIPVEAQKGIKQYSSAKSYSKEQINADNFRVQMIVPYEPDYDMDLDLIVDCSNGRMARTQGLEKVGRLEVGHYAYIIRRTCSR